MDVNKNAHAGGMGEENDSVADDTTPNALEAADFLDRLDPRGEFCYQIFHDDKRLKRHALRRTWHGRWFAYAAKLIDLNAQGIGVFVTINKTDGRRRRAENVTDVRAVFVDLDGAPLGPVKECTLAPHIIVESSPGRWHAYWLVDGLPLKSFKAVQKAIASRFGGDPSICDLSRVMRLPGFIRHKVAADGTSKGPFRSRIVEMSDADPYTAEQILTEFPPLTEAPPAKANGGEASPPLGLSHDEIRRCLQGLDAVEYGSWLRVGMALHHETGGSDAGLTLWDQWSQGAPNYDSHEDLARRWAGFGRYGGRMVTMRSVIRGTHGTTGRALTEFGNSDRLLDRYGGGLMYVPELGQWYSWAGAHWRAEPHTSLEMLAKDSVQALIEEVRQCVSAADREALLKFSGRSQKQAMVANMISLARSDARVCVPVAELDKHKHLLGVGNGAVDLRTGALLPPDPQLRITIATDVPYDPHAPAPLFEQTVSEVFSDDPTMVGFFRRLVGYALLGEPNEDVLVIPYGSGANGKSTVLGAIRGALGAHAKSAAAESFVKKGNENNKGAPREDLLRLRGARLVHVSEPDAGSELKEGLIKALTGGDILVARGNYAKHSVEFLPGFVAVLPTNHLPIIKGDDHGIWRRILLVPFTRNFDRDPSISKDPDRAKKLSEELPGILRWCVEGALAYQCRGLKPPQEVISAGEEYRNDMDLLIEWLEEHCEIGPTKAASNQALWNSWENYMRARGDINRIRTREALGKKLAARFQKIKDAHGIRGRGFLGVAPKGPALAQNPVLHFLSLRDSTRGGE